MAANAANEKVVGVEDVAGVRSRISWQAILAGAIIAIAANFVFMLFFGAIGLTLTESGVRANSVGIGALIATILSVLVSLFIGGWVATQMTAGETEREALLYGILTWAAVVGISVMLVGMGVRAGYFAVMGGAMVAQQSQQSWEQVARNAGYTQEQINQMKATADPNRVQAVANDPAAQEQAREAMVAASWTALVAVLLSLGTAIGGAMVGRGPTFRLLPVAGVEVRRELSIP